MNDFHGIIFAYSASPELRELVSRRTAASMPIFGRYRVIDFALSSLRNAGIRDVGVIMQRDYQSLMDHVRSGKSWDMSRKDGGIRLLPPFGMPGYHSGNYFGTMEALNAVGDYVRGIPQKYVVLLLGSMCANLDLRAAAHMHLHSGAPITAICSASVPDAPAHRYIVGPDGYVKEALFYQRDEGRGFASMEGYIIDKELLVKMMDECAAKNLYRFHRDAIAAYLAGGGKMDIYLHEGYYQPIRSVDLYYRANRDMLDPEKLHDLFCPERPIRTRHSALVSTYYGEKAVSKCSLIGDNCRILGTVENCVLSSEVVVEEGAYLKDCVVMRRTTIGKGAKLESVIVDKDCVISPDVELKGNEKLPLVVPKGSRI